MKTRTFNYIVIMVVYTVTMALCVIEKNYDYVRLLILAMIAASSVYWVPEDKNEKPPIKGIIQFDKKHYDIPAIRFTFYGDPLNLINYDEVTFKVDRNASIEDDVS